MAGTGATIDEIISKPGKWGNPPIPSNDSLHPLSAGNKFYFIEFIFALKFRQKYFFWMFGLFDIKLPKNVSKYFLFGLKCL